MKKTKSILVILLLISIAYSCNNSAVQRLMEEDPERAVGMSAWEGVEEMKWHIGTQEAVDIANKMDSAWRSRDYETMKEFISDTAQITATNGFIFRNVEEFIESRKRNDSAMNARGATFDWTTTNIFSVDLDPSTGGEHVHADYYGMYTLDGQEDNFRVLNRYYIVEGKIIMWNSYWQEIIEPKAEEELLEETEE
jgi:hypothetical protein